MLGRRKLSRQRWRIIHREPLAPADRQDNTLFLMADFAECEARTRLGIRQYVGFSVLEEVWPAGGPADRDAGVVAQPHQIRQDFALMAGSERGERLVEQKELRPH